MPKKTTKKVAKKVAKKTTKVAKATKKTSKPASAVPPGKVSLVIRTWADTDTERCVPQIEVFATRQMAQEYFNCLVRNEPASRQDRVGSGPTDPRRVWNIKPAHNSNSDFLATTKDGKGYVFIELRDEKEVKQ